MALAGGGSRRSKKHRKARGKAESLYRELMKGPLPKGKVRAMAAADARAFRELVRLSGKSSKCSVIEPMLGRAIEVYGSSERYPFIASALKKAQAKGCFTDIVVTSEGIRRR